MIDLTKSFCFALCLSFSAHKEGFKATTFTQEQKSVFKLKSNNKTFILRIININ